MKIALLHDFFAEPGRSGGGEKLALLLAKIFNADIYTGFAESGFEGLENFSVTQLSKKSFSGFRTINIMKSFERLKLENYDFFIFSGTNCITASARNKPNILYMHTPPRYLYDMREWYNKHTNIFGRAGLFYLRRYVYPRDQFYVKQLDRIVTNSETVRKRISQYYGEDVFKKSKAVYSFVDNKKYHYREPKDYYVSNARLDPLKRVDLIVKAFCEMPNKKLVVISTGPEMDKIKKIASGHDNIEIRGWVPENEMIDIMSRCICTIQMPINEDLGLGAIESMACGKPCIGANEGGLTETIVKNRTGLLINPTIDEIVKSINFMTPEKSKSMKNACIQRANKFSKNNFIRTFKKEVEDTLSKIK